MKNAIVGYDNKEGLNGNLQYFKTSLIKKAKNKDQVVVDLTQKCTEMLCVKENIFNIDIEKGDYKIFSSNKKNKFLCVYYNFLDDSFEEFLETIKELNGEKKIYIFSIDGKVDQNLFAGVADFEIEEIPQKILDIYKQLVKMNIPAKSDMIFADFDKAKVKIFTEKEKDDGARILRIVLEKLMQRIAQDSGINILKNNSKEEKCAILNDKLKSENIFSKVVWEENKTYLAVGNHASHGEYGEYDLKNVENFYRHTQKLIDSFNI
jgi:adenine-specific DNA-methyltransferase